MEEPEVAKLIIGKVHEIVEKLNGQCHVILIVEHDTGVHSFSNIGNSDGPAIPEIASLIGKFLLSLNCSSEKIELKDLTNLNPTSN